MPGFFGAEDQSGPTRDLYETSKKVIALSNINVKSNYLNLGVAVTGIMQPRISWAA